MRALRDKGITSLVSSHILAELEEYCTSMLVLRDGHIKQHVSLQAHQQTQQALLAIMFAAPLTPAQEIAVAAAAGQKITINAKKMVAHISVVHDPAGQHALLKSLLVQDIPVCGFALEEASLQSLYLETAKRDQEKPA